LSIKEEFESSSSYNDKNFSSAVRQREWKQFLRLRKIKLDYERKQLRIKLKEEAERKAALAKLSNKKVSGSQVLLVLDCKVYQSIHKIGSISAQDPSGFKSMMFTVSQERKRLRFLGYDFVSSAFYEFSYPEEVQIEVVEGFKEITMEEIAIQFQMGMLNAEFRDLPEKMKVESVISGRAGEAVVRPPQTYITFGMEGEGDGGVQFHMSAADEKRAAKNLDEMMKQSADRQHSRQHSAEHRLADEEKGQWGLVEEE